MALLNTTVIRVDTKKTLLKWTIISLQEVEYSFVEFFTVCIRPRLPSSSQTSEDQYKLERVEVGPSKDMLDSADVALKVVEVTKHFGKFVKLLVKPKQTEYSEVANPSKTLNAFQVLLAAQQSKSFLEPVNEKNNKDKLYNDLVKLLKEKGLTLSTSQDEIDFGVRLLKCIRDILWYIDGAHQVLGQRSRGVPSVFSKYNGYNIPEKSKHRKRILSNLSSDQLSRMSNGLVAILQGNAWSRVNWRDFKPDVLALAESLAEYVSTKTKVMKTYHASPNVVREISQNLRVHYLPVSRNVVPPTCLLAIEEAMYSKSPFEYKEITDLLPSDPLKKHRVVSTLVASGLKFPTLLLVYSPGSNVGNLHFLWRVPANSEPSNIFERSQSVIEKVKGFIPQYHTRAMRKEMYSKFGRISPQTKPLALRWFYKEVTNDQSAAATPDQAEVDKRVQLAIDMEDADIVMDLRQHNMGRVTRFDTFWNECGKFLNEEIGVAVDERRHGTVTHLGRAISVRDLVDQVKSRCPENTPIPSVEWTRLQFWPKTPAARSAMQYTGKYRMKFMVQQRQWRHSHVDSHYAAGIFRYMREYALLLRDVCTFVCMDDKHKIKIGEPDCPVAAAERGRRVPVRAEEHLTVADHDFTKFGMVPSCILVIDLPEEISESWYRGQVFVSLKESTFEPSSPFRHACELHQVLKSLSFDKRVLFLYSDGGPDHRLTYVTVQLSLICLFLKLDLDYLCAGRTAPYHSWRNPIERMMSILNLGLQCVGLARAKMPEEYEKEAAKCNSMTQIRKIAEKNPNFVQAVSDSISPVKCLLSSVFMRLYLKEKQIRCNVAATSEEISDFWSVIIALDITIDENAKYGKANIQNHERIYSFIQHCCRSSHYTFDILKCGVDSCTLCKPVTLPREVFDKIKHIPLPKPGADGHYLPFSDILGQSVTEEYRPSLQQKSKPRKKSLPFYASVQHVKNARLMVQCEECQMWRLVFSKHKLNITRRQYLQRLLEDYTYTCGSTLAELDLGDDFKDIEIRDHACGDVIEKLYYSAEFEPICVYCGVNQPFTSADHYPQCDVCSSREPVKK